MSSPLERSTKASELISFLDKIETEIEEDAASTIAGSNAEEYNDETLSIHNNNKNNGNNNNIFHDIKQKMIGLKVELNDKTKTMKLLELALKKSTDKQQSLILENKKELKKQLNRQKKEFQIITNRHLLFVDRLLNDKENLNKKCEDLTNEINKLQENCKNKINKLENKHRKTIKKTKQEWNASQQIKREEWIKNKTKQIKSMTIRGLQPEIERIIEKNKKDLQLKDEECADLLREEKEKIYKIFEEKFETQTTKINSDKFSEINILNNKHLGEIESINKLKEMQLNEQMTRINKQWNQERERNKLLNETTLNKIINSHKNEIKKLNELNKELIINNNKKSEIDVKKLNEKYKIEKNEWIQIMNKKYKKEFKEKEVEFIELFKQQQKDEIDVLIDKLTNEYTEKIKLLQNKNENVIGQYKNDVITEKEKCTKWLKQYENLNKDIKNIQINHKNQIENIEKICNTKNGEIQQLKKEIISKSNEIKNIYESKEIEIKQVNENNNIKSEKLHHLQLEYKECAERLNDSASLHNSEIEELKNMHITEIEKIGMRVRQTLRKKDDWILTLKEQVQTKNMQIHQIENLLQQQRNQLFDNLN